MNSIVLIYFILGLTFLIVGADALVRGAARISAFIGISPLVIGLTIVAFGTSSPELAVSLDSALKHQSDIALGNAVGSNIFNILFILGLSASITPLVVSQQLVRLDVPIMIGISVLLLILGLDGKIGRPDGIVLFSGIVVYTIYLIYQSRQENVAIQKEYAKEYGDNKYKSPFQVVINLALIMSGLALLVLGSRWLTSSAIVIAKSVGVTELVIGLTIVAAGTSLPEIATSVIASFRGEIDIAVGNVVGSNIFNILVVLGVAGVVSPDGINVSPAAIRFDIPVMIASALACLPIFFTGYLIARWEGILFFCYYVTYTSYLILSSLRHPSLDVFTKAMITFVIPITVITLVTVTIRAIRLNQKQAKAD